MVQYQSQERIGGHERDITSGSVEPTAPHEILMSARKLVTDSNDLIQEPSRGDVSGSVEKRSESLQFAFGSAGNSAMAKGHLGKHRITSFHNMHIQEG